MLPLLTLLLPLLPPLHQCCCCYCLCISRGSTGVADCRHSGGAAAATVVFVVFVFVVVVVVDGVVVVADGVVVSPLFPAAGIGMAASSVAAVVVVSAVFLQVGMQTVRLLFCQSRDNNGDATAT